MSTSLRLEGNLFTADFLARLAVPGSDVKFLDAESYGLAPGEKPREAIAKAYNALSARYSRYKTELAKLPEGDPALGVTRQFWLLPILAELAYGRVQTALPIHAGEGSGAKDYPISHGWNRTPIHLLGWNVKLDVRSPGVTGAAQTAPHALVQEALNRSGDHLWAILSNGKKWRLLRDSAAIARQAYIEFDLESIFENGNTADFALFWLLCHASRLESRGTGEDAQPPILEAWMGQARDEGTRARDLLRNGVQSAIEELATGFLRHPSNTALREALRSETLPALDFYRESLRVVYRMLFLLIAESKDTLHPNSADPLARERYESYFSLAALRERASKTRGGAHPDGWEALKLLFTLLRKGEPGLALPGLGGFLFAPITLDTCQLANEDLFKALRSLGYVKGERGVIRAVNFDIQSEELGSIYESLLELTPRLDTDARTFRLETLAGNERKTTGSYYTPDVLVESLLETALDPVIDRAAAEGEAGILALSVVDPACGSGHFLTAAARRIARRLVLVRTGGDEPNNAQWQAALRDVIGHCIYGVDLNPMAVELCKIALWIEGLDPNRPLSFLDAHIRTGNALFGTTHALVEAGLPDEAFKPLEGDDKTVCATLKKENKQQKAGQTTLDFSEPMIKMGDLSQLHKQLDLSGDNTLSELEIKERNWASLQQSNSYKANHLLYDAWCAAFVWRKVKDSDPTYVNPITDDSLRYIRNHGRPRHFHQTAEIQRLSEIYKPFHWELEFPRVFDRGGFDCVLGNPPWEHTELKEKEWFAVRAPEIAEAATAAIRKRMIEALAETDRALYVNFLDARREHDGISHFASSSGRYPLCGRGRINTYALFAEHNTRSMRSNGRVGCILPSGIATDDTTKFYFQSLVEGALLASLFDFENREKIFPAVDSRMKFCLLTLRGESDGNPAQFVFFALNGTHLTEPERRFMLSPEDIALLNPNTKTCPIFRSKRDAELTKAIYRRVPVLINETTGAVGNPWGITFRQGLFNMAGDSGLFRTAADLPIYSRYGSGLAPSDYQPPKTTEGDDFLNRQLLAEMDHYLPLYEAKMFHHYDHRWATYDNGEVRDLNLSEKQDPLCMVTPRYYVNKAEVFARLQQRIPPGLFDAWRVQDAKAVQLILQDWFVGWLFNHDRVDGGDKIFADTTPPMSWDTLSDLISGYLSRRAKVEELERKFPLSEAEHYSIAAGWERPLETAARLIDCRVNGWLLGFRRVCRTTDERSGIFSIIPQVAAGDSVFLIDSKESASLRIALYSSLNSLAFDYVVRQKVGGINFSFFIINQLPVLPPATHDNAATWTNGAPLSDWITPRVLELTYTAYDMTPFARDLGYDGDPFPWDPERRFQLRCELDAAFFHLYGLTREETAYVMDTFPIVRRKDEKEHGHYRTKDTILRLYDEMS